MNNKDFFDDNGIYATEGKVVLRTFRDEDRDAFISLKKDVSDIGAAYDFMPEFAESSWQEALTGSDGNVHVCLEYGSYGCIGYLNLQHPERDIPEIGIDMVKDFRNKGIGYQAVKLLMEHAGLIVGYKIFEAEIYSDNKASTALFKKLGAKKIDVVQGEFSEMMDSFKESLGQEKIDEVWAEHRDVYDKEMAREIVRYHICFDK